MITMLGIRPMPMPIPIPMMMMICLNGNNTTVIALSLYRYYIVAIDLNWIGLDWIVLYCNFFVYLTCLFFYNDATTVVNRTSSRKIRESAYGDEGSNHQQQK